MTKTIVLYGNLSLHLHQILTKNQNSMKKIKLFALLLLAGATVFTSCKKDDPETAAPSITFANSVSSFEIDYSTMANPYVISIIPSVTAEAEIDAFTVSKKDAGGNSTPITVTGDFKGKTSFTETFNISLDSAGNFPYQIIFYVTDKEARSQEKIYTITKKVAQNPTGNPIHSYSAKLLGAQDASAGSFFASSNGTIYSQSQAAANAAIIDITYGVISSTPKIMALTQRGTNGFTAVSGGQNVYYKLSTITVAQFDAMTNDLGFANITASTDQTITVAQSNVYEFVNATKKGLFKVSNIVAGNAGSITIDVKVQQ